VSEILLTRKDKNDHRTIGVFAAPTLPVFHSLEDMDRGLTKGMSLREIVSIKVARQTAIPTGRYEIAINYSNRFQKQLPILLNVPGFEGVRIHSGNTEEDTEGCILIGIDRTFDTITNSRVAMTRLMAWLNKELKTEKVYITIV